MRPASLRLPLYGVLVRCVQCPTRIRSRSLYRPVAIFRHTLRFDDRSPELYHPPPQRRPPQPWSRLLRLVVPRQGCLVLTPYMSRSRGRRTARRHTPGVCVRAIRASIQVDFSPALSHMPNRFNRLDRFLIINVSKAVLEVIALAVLWLLWLIGCGIATVRLHPSISL